MRQLIKRTEATATISATKNEVERTNLILDSLKTISLAKEEINFGNSAAASFSRSTAKDEWQIKQMAEISLWHYECGIKKLQEAISLLENSANNNSSVRTKHLITQHIIKCRRLILSTKHLINQIGSRKNGHKRKILKVAKETRMRLAPLANL